MINKIAITIGDPNGIGPEITIKALQQLKCSNKIVVIGNSDILKFYGGCDVCSEYEIIEIPYDKKNINVGKIDKFAGEFAFRALEKACLMAQEHKIDGIVTAPVSKNSMNLAGHCYSGQTEVLEKYLAKSEQQAQMLFCAKNLNVLLLTRHIPLSVVSQKITQELVINTVLDTQKVFCEKFNVANPKFALCAINPHAGEDGILGSEEQDILIPAVNKLKYQNTNIQGPFPADAFFAKIAETYWQNNKSLYDCIFVPYHDQGLIPVKMLAGKKAVNTTIGLDVIRTSPSHGTAFDIAGKNIADPSSMIEAINFLLNLKN